MKNAILIHGWASKAEFYNPNYPSASNSHWFPWLTKQLMINNIHAVAPEMPNGYYPEYMVWKNELERFDITSETILVGHSLGAGFLMRWLSEKPERKVNKVILVAPWMGHAFSSDPFDETFFNFELNREIASQTKGLHIFNSTDDFSAIQEGVTYLRENVDDIVYHELKGKGHFTLNDIGTEELPELLDEILLNQEIIYEPKI